MDNKVLKHIRTRCFEQVSGFTSHAIYIICKNYLTYTVNTRFYLGTNTKFYFSVKYNFTVPQLII